MKARAIGKNYELTLLVDESRPNLFKSLVTFSKVDLFDSGIDLILQVDNPDIANGGKFITDANGYFEMERQSKEKWETSVFPVNSHFVIEDPNTQQKQGYFTDISQGGISPVNGSMQVYIQRSAKVDD